MEEIEEERVNNLSSPPRKKMKTNGEPGMSAAISSESLLPNSVHHKINAHEGGCTSISFLNNSNILISGGKDSTIKLWDTSNGTLTSTLQGFQGSVYDLAISSDNSLLVAALTSRKLCVWDLNSGQIRRTLMGHDQKVCAVDIGKVSSRCIVSGGNDHIIKFWDLQEAYSTRCAQRIQIVLVMQFALPWMKTQFALAILMKKWSSIALTGTSLGVTVKWRSIHNIKYLGVISPDDNFVVVGSADGSVHVWSLKMGRMVNTLKEDSDSVLACSWSGMGRSLASTDDDGTICIWS